MGKRAIIITAAAVLATVAGIIAVSNISPQPINYGEYRMSVIRDISKSLPKMNPDSVFEASENTGGLPEKVVGDLSTAKVVVYEYADYSCVHCAEWSKTVNKLVDNSNGELAVVFRGYELGLFKNSLVAASAATAAQIQDCWREYEELLFANQNEWSNLSGEKLKDELIICFEKASKNQGDVEKFKADMASENVAKKIAFEQRLGDEIELTGTPTFRIDGEKVEVTSLEKVIKEKLKS